MYNFKKNLLSIFYIENFLIHNFKFFIFIILELCFYQNWFKFNFNTIKIIKFLDNNLKFIIKKIFAPYMSDFENFTCMTKLLHV